MVNNINRLILNKEHLAIIDLLQDFHKKFNISPSTKALINYATQYAPELNLNSLTFAILFPGGIKEACLAADVPINNRCL